MESPQSRDFVNSKNDNIWKIREIDIKDKPDLGVEEDIRFHTKKR